MWINNHNQQLARNSSIIVAIITCLVVSETKAETVNEGVLTLTEDYIKHRGLNSSLEGDGIVIKDDIKEHTIDPHTILQEENEMCKTDDDCQHDGTCYEMTGDKKICGCKRGTSGSFCEVIDACERNPNKCGNSTDVECVWSSKKKRAVCKCNKGLKEFDQVLNQCRKPCQWQFDCFKGTCNKNKPSDEFSFCSCPWGRAGDRCEDTIDECKKEGIDCGSNPNVVCTAKSQGGSYCKCPDRLQAYDVVEKVCKNCNCGSKQLGCEFNPGGSTTCFCEIYHYSDGEVCRECNCGDRRVTCKLENGTKVCNCVDNYSDDGNGTCKECECGPNSSGCSFEDGEKMCNCKEGYIQFNSTCRKRCWEDYYCRNGGKCVDNVCQCLPGTTGEECNIVEPCLTYEDTKKVCGNPDRVYCAYNITSQSFYCRCRIIDYFYDPYDKDCKECDCGAHGNCSFVKGVKTCACEDGYAMNNYTYSYYKRKGQCEACDCGDPSQGCEFNGYYKKTCYCNEGYKQNYREECERCDCGQRGKCNFNGWSKVCDCDKGFVDNGGTCEACDCGPYGECSFVNGKKTCACEDGFAVDSINVPNELKCEACNCYFGFEKVNCTFLFRRKKCLCPGGFQQVGDICLDVDECLDRYSCPDGTTCVNTYGSYECPCREGFRPKYEDRDPKTHGCEDIDECFESNPCMFTDTTWCLNTVGSYRCECKTGYNPEPPGSAEYKGCLADQSDWRIGYIFLLVVFSTVIIGLLLKIYMLRCRK